jgi:hypothetical protein
MAAAARVSFEVEMKEMGMQDEPNSERTRGASRTALGSHFRVAPSASRMLTSYLNDIEQALDEQRWEVALREAQDLPRIAVALSDPQLHASGEKIKSWCDEWIRPEDPDSNARGAEYERVSSSVLERTTVDESLVPSLALKRLRLRRHARTPPRGFSPERTQGLDARGTNALETCTILVDAARRWYAQCAVHDPAVQANLARLAVLR